MSEENVVNPSDDRSGFDASVMWLREQWCSSLAKSIWDDLTPLGRATIWLPIWFLCWATLPPLLIIGGVLWVTLRIGERPFAWVGRQFFK
jgi:hypothetical protein